MKTKRSPAAEAPPPTSGLAEVARLVEEGSQTYREIRAREDRIERVRREDRLAPYVEACREPVENARKALPLLKAYQAATAEVRSQGEALGLDVGPHSLVAESNAGLLITQIEEASRLYDDLASGRFRGDPHLAQTEILQSTKGAETHLPAKQAKLAALVAKMKEVQGLRGRTGLAPEGPPVQRPNPKPRTDGSEEALTSWNVFDVGGR